MLVTVYVAVSSWPERASKSRGSVDGYFLMMLMLYREGLLAGGLAVATAPLGAPE
jgi:hypothetical protein